jgi:hypothetical protein
LNFRKIEKGKENHFFSFLAFLLYNKSGCITFLNLNGAQKYLEEITFQSFYFDYRKGFSIQ